jgi:hypothetical protein
LASADLRDDLVAAAVEVEAIGMPPASMTPSSRPTEAQVEPEVGDLSLSIMRRAWGRSILRSVSAYRNLPLAECRRPTSGFGDAGHLALDRRCWRSPSSTSN